MHVAAAGTAAAAVSAHGSGAARVSSTDSTAAAITRRLHAEAAALYHRSPAVSPQRFGSSLSTLGLPNSLSGYNSSSSSSSSASSSRSQSPLPGALPKPFDPSVCAPYMDLASLEAHMRLTLLALDKAKRRFLAQFGTLSVIAIACCAHAVWDQVRDRTEAEMDGSAASSSSSGSVLLLLACIVILLLYVASGTWFDRMTGSATYILACNRWMSLFGVQWDRELGRIVIEELPSEQEVTAAAAGAQAGSGKRSGASGVGGAGGGGSRRRASGGSSSSIASSVSSASTLMRLLHEPDAEYEARKRSGIASGWINESPLSKARRSITPMEIAPTAAPSGAGAGIAVPIIGAVSPRASLSEPSTPSASGPAAAIPPTVAMAPPPQPQSQPHPQPQPQLLHPKPLTLTFPPASPAHAHPAAAASPSVHAHAHVHGDHLTVPPTSTLSSAVAALIRSASNPALAAAAAAAAASGAGGSASPSSSSSSGGSSSPTDIRTLTPRDAKFLHSSIFSPDLSPGSADEAEVVLASPGALRGQGGASDGAGDALSLSLPPPKDERERVMQQMIRRSKSMESAMAALQEQERQQRQQQQEQQQAAESDQHESPETENSAEPTEPADSAEPDEPSDSADPPAKEPAELEAKQ